MKLVVYREAVLYLASQLDKQRPNGELNLVFKNFKLFAFRNTERYFSKVNQILKPNH